MITSPITRPITSRIASAIAGARVGGASNPLVWHAATPDSDGVMQAQLIGVGSPAFTSSDMLLLDYIGEYVLVPANSPAWVGARWSGGVAYATGESGDNLASLPYLYVAPGRENLNTYSNDLSNGAWTKAGSASAALDANGLTGAGNTATTATDPGGSSFIYRATTIVATTYTYTARWFVKKDEDTTRFPGCFVEYGGGGGAARAWYHLNTSTGELTAVALNAGVYAAESLLRGDWWEVLISVDNTSKTSITQYFLPADASVAGTRSAAASGSAIVGNMELYADSDIDCIRGTAPIITAGSSASLIEVNGVFDSGNMSNTLGALYFEAITQKASPILATFIEVNGVNIALNDGSSTVTRPWVKNTPYQIGIIWDAASELMALNVNGTWSNDVAYDGTLLGGALDVFSSPEGAGLIRNIKRYSPARYEAGRALIDAEMP